jgi:hypothetical protein
MAERTKEQIRKLSAHFQLPVTPWDWLRKARSLRDAFNHLLIHFEEKRLAFDEKFEREESWDLESPDDSVVMMILGFAIENLLKGLYVSTLSISKRPQRIKDLGEKSHKLAAIAMKIEAALRERFSESEVCLLNAIEQTILWHGRYPSPVHVDKLVSTSSDGLFATPSFRYPDHHFDACALYDRLESLLIPRAPFRAKKNLLGTTYYVGLMPGEAD